MVAVGQLAPGDDAGANWAAASRLIEQAAAGGAKLVVLPEQTMLAQPPGQPQRFARLAAAAWEWWPQALSDAARRLGVAVVAGGFAAASAQPFAARPVGRAASDPGLASNHSGPGHQSDQSDQTDQPGAADQDLRPWNVLVAVDQDGNPAACQAKTRLYDAFSYRESDFARPGPPHPTRPVDLAGLRLGLVNCYELRFPELARELVLGGAEVLTLSAAWARGPLKEDQWATLARARAIENCAYVLAAGTRAKDTIGHSMIIDPGGVVRAGLSGEPEGLALAEVDTDVIAQTRALVGSVPTSARR
ncbi:MAG: hypothetical protein LBG60_06515 [Bifidobacteriaceae bacterium]|jgi:predicted amidohydrolase|nr:hypothetical protein [Bifidobacteriaceae bacterium]